MFPFCTVCTKESEKRGKGGKAETERERVHERLLLAPCLNDLVWAVDREPAAVKYHPSFLHTHTNTHSNARKNRNKRPDAGCKTCRTGGEVASICQCGCF